VYYPARDLWLAGSQQDSSQEMVVRSARSRLALKKSHTAAQAVQISVDSGVQRAAISWVIRSAYTTSGVGLSNTGQIDNKGKSFQRRSFSMATKKKAKKKKH
jgi:hypothetical protein